jgi:small subunit ribosomal protein S6
LREQERAPRKYELMTILHPEVDEESLPGELDRINGYITEVGGELIESLRDSPWGRRRLAYPIRSGGKDVRDGHYTVWHFELSPTKVTELERELKLNTQVIRYIVVSWEPKVLDEKEIEAAEIAAEDAAAAAYAAAEAAAAAAEAQAEDDAAAAYAAAESAASQAMGLVAQPDAESGEAAAETESAEALTAEAEAVEATGADLAIEAVAAVEEREELEADAAAALAKAEAAVEAEAEAAVEVEAEAAPATAEAETEAVVPEGAVRGDDSGECPEDHPVKGNASSMLYHTPGSPSYKRTNPEFCFASVQAAEAAGFNPTKYEAAQEEGE